ncbi:MAG: glycogen debranching enzyme GlgX [Mycobacterium sp.]|nr:glycogen debranching enzyme GlgX [Mycobacterium sp.]
MNRIPPEAAWPGSPAPLGVTWDGAGINVAVYSESAEGVDLCLFDVTPDGKYDPSSERRIPLLERSGAVWHGYVAGCGPGQRYGLRVAGRYDPVAGHRHNPDKLLLDPYTRQLAGTLTLDPAIFGYTGDPTGTRRDHHDSAPFVPHGVVTAGDFPWGSDRPPRIPWSETAIYELHVKGFTQLHPAVPPALRGTYAGLAQPAVIEHLVSLGVTAVELLPVQAHVSESRLLAHGQTNYWGYNTIGYFAPHPGYAASDDPVSEFRAMVRQLHEAGLEVILDVVYNHTAEGGEEGPTLSFRGLDNASYYRLRPGDRRRYLDPTGCGNTLDLSAAPVLALVLDSLRYWVSEMHVDGFRFDLTSTLMRDSAFVEAVGQDPLLREVKLIAEPWDMSGYDLGGFPSPWAEWNDQYRDTLRGTWHRHTPSLATLATRVSGSADIFARRSPTASVNFVTAHDGFTLADLVSYEHKHNLDNGEGNHDGSDNNASYNGGEEGPTSDPVIQARRHKLRRAQLATLLLSAGVPMLVAGDELGRTQNGNNNAYCQDNEMSWVAWPYDKRDPAGHDPLLVPLVSGLLRLRRRSPVLRRTTFFRGGRVTPGDVVSAVPDISWFHPAGHVMEDGDWRGDTVTLHVSGQALAARTRHGARIIDDSYLIVLHVGEADTSIVLPGPPWGRLYAPLLDTAADDLGGFPHLSEAIPPPTVRAGIALPVTGQSVRLLRVLG